MMYLFFFSSRRRHTRWPRDWSSDVCSSDLGFTLVIDPADSDFFALGRTLEPALQVRILGDRRPPLANENRLALRSEERRVGKECRTWWSRNEEQKKKQSEKER